MPYVLNFVFQTSVRGTVRGNSFRDKDFYIEFTARSCIYIKSNIHSVCNITRSVLMTVRGLFTAVNCVTVITVVRSQLRSEKIHFKTPSAPQNP